MNNFINIFLSFLFISSALADPGFKGPIRFKGEIFEDEFRGRSFEIKVKKDQYLVVPKNEKIEWSFEHQSNRIWDLIVSRESKALAVCLEPSDPQNSDRLLITIDQNKKKRFFSYKNQDLIKGFGWIQELAAVSDDGKLILAKCAKYLPRNEEGMKMVNHWWIIFSIGEQRLEILDAENALNNWSDLVSAHLRRTTKTMPGTQ